MEGSDRRPKSRKPRNSDPGSAPNRAALHEAALGYLARGAATADSVTRTLERRVGNWARRAARAGRDAEAIASEAAQAREVIGPIVERLREVGLVDDTAFAASRARTMTNAGRSRRAIAAHLAKKGVAAATVRESVPHDASAELTAAVTFARKKRLGPFSRDTEGQDREEKRAADRKALGAMARAGFDFSVCERVLRMDLEDAEARLRGAREL